MYKFPKLNYLGIDSLKIKNMSTTEDAYSISTIHSVNVICEFFAYLSQLSRYSLEYLKIASDVLIESIAQLSKCFPAKNLQIACSHSESIEFAMLSLVPNRKSGSNQVSL